MTASEMGQKEYYDLIHYNEKHGRDQKAFEKWDKLGKIYAIWMFYYMYQIDATVNPDVYNVDLILYDRGKKWGYADAKIKPWIDNFKFDTLWIPGRYDRYFYYEQVEKKPVLFAIFNPSGTICYMTRAAYLLELEKIDVKSPRPGFETEPTYLVPMDKVRIFEIKRQNPFLPELQKTDTVSIEEGLDEKHKEWEDWINQVKDRRETKKEKGVIDNGRGPLFNGKTQSKTT